MLSRILCLQDKTKGSKTQRIFEVWLQDKCSHNNRIQWIKYIQLCTTMHDGKHCFASEQQLYTVIPTACYCNLSDRPIHPCLLSVPQPVTVTPMVQRTEECATATPTLPSAWWEVSAAARQTWRGRAATSVRPATSAWAQTVLRAANVSAIFVSTHTMMQDRCDEPDCLKWSLSINILNTQRVKLQTETI